MQLSLAGSLLELIHRRALQDFPDTIQVSIHKSDKINLPIL
jgi:hypothetical protein